MKRHRFVNAYELRDAVLYCGCGSNVCVRIVGGTRPCPLLGRVDPEEVQVAARDAVERIRETILHGVEWLQAIEPAPSSIACGHANEVPAACPCDRFCYCKTEGPCRLAHVNAMRVFYGFARVSSIAEHEAQVAAIKTFKGSNR